MHPSKSRSRPRGQSNDRPVVVIFMPGLSARGGAERYAVVLAAVLAERGLAVTMATTGLDSLSRIGEYFDVDLSDVSLLRLREAGPGSGQLPVAVSDLMRDFAWSVQISALRPRFVFNSWYKSEMSVPRARNIYLCHFPHARDVRFDSIRSAYMRGVRFIRSVLFGGFPDVFNDVIANSQFTADNVLVRWGRRADVIHPPCPMVGIGEAGGERRSIISVGRFVRPQEHVPNKRFDVLVNAFRQATDLHAEGWTLDIVGSCDADGRAYLEELRVLAGDSPVRFHTSVGYEELVALYRSAAIYWHAQGFDEDVRWYPEAHEHFGMSTVEAMSAGCVPVVHGSAGPAEVVRPLPMALTWHSVPELLDHTRRIIEMPHAERDLIVRSGLARAIDFDLERFRADLGDFLAHNLNVQQR